MKDIYKRYIMFLLLCIPTRAYIAYKAKNTSKENLKIMGYISLIVSLSMLFIYLTDLRQSGLETQGAKIWWNNLRPVFSIIYMLFALSAIDGKDYAYKFLIADVILGFIAFINNHSSIRIS